MGIQRLAVAAQQVVRRHAGKNLLLPIASTFSSSASGGSGRSDSGIRTDNSANLLTKQPLSLGYIAGLQSTPMQQSTRHSDDSNTNASRSTPWTTFDKAYDIQQQINPDMLLEFETNLWEHDQILKNNQGVVTQDH